MPVPLAVVTETVPVVAPAGTAIVIDEAVEADTTAVEPLNLTVLLAGVVLKLVPVMVITVPTAPEVGLMPVTVGVVAADEVTVKLPVDVPGPPAVVTEIVPFVAPTGTVTASDVAVAPVTVARVPLNLTVLLAGVSLKLAPVIVTAVPTVPEVGLMELTTGIPAGAALTDIEKR